MKKKPGKCRGEKKQPFQESEIREYRLKSPWISQDTGKGTLHLDAGPSRVILASYSSSWSLSFKICERREGKGRGGEKGVAG